MAITLPEVPQASFGGGGNAGTSTTGIQQTAYIIPQTVFSGSTVITATVTMEESYEDALVVTDHPVDVGTMMTDHSYRRPAEVHLRCGWSNSDLEAQSNLQQPSIQSGSGSTSDYVTAVYMQLLALQQSRTAFQLQTSIRIYDNMLMTSIGLTRDSKTSQALFVTVHCREVLFVSTSTYVLPPTANQANAENTGETVQTGTQSVQSSSAAGSLYPFPGPSSGGSLPAPDWSATYPTLSSIISP